MTEANPSKLRERAWTVGFMLMTSFVYTSAVSLTYLSTKSTVEANERMFMQRAVLSAAAIDVPSERDPLIRTYRDRVKEVRGPAGTVRYFEVVDASGRPTGYVLPCQGKGLWGTIRAVVGFRDDARTMTGLDFTTQNETPGLGGRITEDWFRNQFKGKHGPFRLVAEGTENEGPSEFDGITGATITSTAVLSMLNDVVAVAPGVTGREGTP